MTKLLQIVSISNDDSFNARIANWAKVGAVHFQHFRDLAGALTGSDITNSLVLLDVGSPLSSTSEFISKSLPVNNTIACYQGTADTCIDVIAKHPTIRAVIAKDSTMLACALDDIVKSFTTKDDPTTSLKNFIPADAAVSNRIVKSSRQRNSCLDELMAKASTRSNFSDFAPMIATVAWEILMNAIYSAPIDLATRSPKYAKVSRSTEIDLLENEYVDFTYFDADSAFGVIVRDKFGTLPQKAIIESITRPLQKTGTSQFRDGNHGAGVGYHMIVQQVSLLSIRVIPGVSTAITALFHQTKRRKDYMQVTPSVIFNFAT